MRTNGTIMNQDKHHSPAGDWAEPVIVLTAAEFEKLRILINLRLGIALSPAKKDLVNGRLQKVLKARGFASFEAYYQFLVHTKDSDALSELADHISTQHTYFYREKEHFEFFSKVYLPAIAKQREDISQKDLRVWCAGCSTGEEAYTLVILMLDYFQKEYPLWQAGVLATDISSAALVKAREGLYPEERLRALPRHLKSKYLHKTSDGSWAVDPRIRREVIFRRLNLIQGKFPLRKPFDIIFCRNVMIYFDEPTRESLIRRLYDWITPGGYLFIGQTESIRHNAVPFEYIMPALYRKQEKL